MSSEFREYWDDILPEYVPPPEPPPKPPARSFSGRIGDPLSLFNFIPREVWVGLLTADDVELDVPGYRRVRATTPDEPLSHGTSVNFIASFGPAERTWPAIYAFAAFDAEAGGNMLYSRTFGNTVTPRAGDTFQANIAISV